MSVPDGWLGTRHRNVVQVREARPADRPAIEDLLTAAYHQIFHALPRNVLPQYVSWLLRPDPAAAVVVADLDRTVTGVGRFVRVPDSSGWLAARSVVAHPDARRSDVTQALVGFGESLATRARAVGFGFHLPSFMPGAPALYRLLGYHRAAAADLDLGAELQVTTPVPLVAHAYRRRLSAPSWPRRRMVSPDLLAQELARAAN